MTGHPAAKSVKPRPDQVAYRRQEAARLRQEGCTARQIAAALNVSVSTVSNDLEAMCVSRKRLYGGVADPPAVDWLNPPAAVVPDPVDRVALAVRFFLAEMNAARYESAHAHDVLDARRHRDQGWLAHWEGLLAQLRQVCDILERLHEGGSVSISAAIASAVTAPPAVASGLAPALPADMPAGLRAEIAEAVSKGMAINRHGLARRYGVNDHAVRLEYERARARAEVARELLAAGWSPPNGRA